MNAAFKLNPGDKPRDKQLNKDSTTMHLVKEIFRLQNRSPSPKIMTEVLNKI